jgi:hypothetical protein
METTGDFTGPSQAPSFTKSPEAPYHTVERLPRRLFVRACTPAATKRNRDSRGPETLPRRQTGLEEERDTKCPNQRVP